MRTWSAVCSMCHICISNCAHFLYSSFLTKKISAHMFVTPSLCKYFSLNNVFPSPPHRVIEPGLHHNIGVVCTFISTLPCYFFSTLRLQRSKTKPLRCFLCLNLFMEMQRHVNTSPLEFLVCAKYWIPKVILLSGFWRKLSHITVNEHASWRYII